MRKPELAAAIAEKADLTKEQANTRCSVVEKSAPARLCRLGWRAAFFVMPISGLVLPILGMFDITPWGGVIVLAMLCLAAVCDAG